MTPRVSVVIPAHNAEWCIGAAIASVLWQTWKDVDLVVVDDGSTDRTAAIAAAHGDRVTLVQQENRGVASARNAGIATASGALITFCDADDILLPEHLRALVETYDANGGIATANSYWLLPGGIHRSKMRYKGRFPAPDEQRRAILEQNFVSTLSLFGRELVDEIGGFDERLARAEDWDFWLRAIFAGHRVALQRQPLALYRWGARSLSADVDAMDEAIESVVRAAARRDDLTPAEAAYLRRRLSGPGPRRLAREGDRLLREGAYSEAAARYRDAAALCPSERMLVWKARALAPAPRVLGPLVRERQLRIERTLGLDADHIR